MFKNISRGQLIGGWCAAVLVAGVCAVMFGAAPSFGNGELLLVAGLVPAAVVLFVWRGAPPATVGEVLHSVDIAAKDQRP